jgi:hypothetical protein
MSEQLTGKTYLQKLQTFAYVCLGAPLIFFIYLYLESSVDELIPKIDEAYNTYLFLPSGIICVAMIYFNFKSYNSTLEDARTKKNLKEKLFIYREVSNRRFIIYGICCGILVVGFYLTNYQAFAASYGIMIVLFSIHNPSSRRIVNDLRLKDEEKKVILTGMKIP